MAGMTVCGQATKVVMPGDITELVRGQETGLVERLAPVVRRESVELDLSAVTRIDAAGLAALITLYCDACKAGHAFRVTRPGPHVREILGLVGLDRLLFGSIETAGRQGVQLTAA